MSDFLSSSLHTTHGGAGHFSFLRHPTKILRRTQSNIIGGSSSAASGSGGSSGNIGYQRDSDSSTPSSSPSLARRHFHFPSIHSEAELKTVSELATTFLQQWESSRREQQHQHQLRYQTSLGSHHLLYQHNRGRGGVGVGGGFGPWRRWGSYRERTAHTSEHSLASVDLGSWSSRAAHRRGSSLPLPFCPALGPVEAVRKAEAFEGVQAAIIKLFQRNSLKENELGMLQESVRALSDADAGPLIYEYYKDQLLKKGMVILREKIKNDQGAELLEKLGETWDYFFTQILPTLQALMHPIADSTKDIDIRNTTLLEFRNIVVLKVGLRETVDSKKHEIPANIRQMLLVLQGLHDPTFLSKEQYDLEKLVACVVVPFLGSRGLYQGGPEPVTKANYRPALPLGPRAKPKITITVSDAAATEERGRRGDSGSNNSSSLGSVIRSPRLPAVRLDQHHPIASPASMRKLHHHLHPQGAGGPGASVQHEPSSSHGTLNHRLKPVLEVLDVGHRRHSIVGT